MNKNLLQQNLPLFLVIIFIFFCRTGFSQNYRQAKNESGEIFKRGALLIELNGLKGIISKSGKVIIPIQYKNIIPIQKNLAIVQDTNGYFGCFGNNANHNIPCLYDSLIFCNDSLFIVIRKSKFGLLTKTNHILLEVKYKSIRVNTYGNTLVEDFNQYKIVKADKDTIVIDGDKLDFIGSLYHYSYNDIHVLLDSVGQKIGEGDINWIKTYKSNLNQIKIIFETPLSKITAADSLLPFKKDGLWGLANALGDTALQAIFDYVFPLQDSLSIIKTGNKYGFANKYGKICLLPYADSLRILNPNAVLYKNNNYWCILDQHGYIKSDTVYECIEELSSFNCFVTKNGDKSGVLSYDGSSILTNSFPILFMHESNGMLTIKNESQYLAIVGPTGQQLLDTSYQYQEIMDFKNGYARVKKFDKYGYINKSGGLTIATQYPQVGEIIHDRVAVMIKNKWAVVDGWEKMIAQPYYAMVATYEDSVAIAVRDNKYLLLDYYGNELFAPKYENIKKLYSNIYLVYKGKKAGLINKKGHEFIFTKYDSITDANDLLVIYKEFGKYGIISIDDKKITNANYAQLILHPTKNEYIIKIKGSWQTFRF